MTENSEMSKSEQRSLALASATLGPWRAAAAVGALGGGVAFAVSTIAEGLGMHAVTTAISVLLTLFFLVGGAGAALGGQRGAAGNQRIRRWAVAHPWRVAAVPGVLMAVSDVVVRQLLSSEPFFSSLGDGIWRGVVVAGVVGLVGRYGGRGRG